MNDTHDYRLITYVQYCTVYENMWRSGPRSEPRWGAYSALQSPDPPVKHTSLHNRLGVLKCSKTHLQQTRISKISRGRGQTPGPSLLDPPLHNEQGRQMSNAGPDGVYKMPETFGSRRSAPDPAGTAYTALPTPRSWREGVDYLGHFKHL